MNKVIKVSGYRRANSNVVYIDPHNARNPQELLLDIKHLARLCGHTLVIKQVEIRKYGRKQPMWEVTRYEN